MHHCCRRTKVTILFKSQRRRALGCYSWESLGQGPRQLWENNWWKGSWNSQRSAGCPCRGVVNSRWRYTRLHHWCWQARIHRYSTNWPQERRRIKGVIWAWKERFIRKSYLQFIKYRKDWKEWIISVPYQIEKSLGRSGMERWVVRDIAALDSWA